MSPRTSGLDFRTIFRRAASTFSQESPATTFKIRYASSSANWGIASGSGVTDFFGVVASVEVPLADSLEPGPGEDCPNPGKSSCCTGSVCKTDLGTGCRGVSCTGAGAGAACGLPRASFRVERGPLASGRWALVSLLAASAFCTRS